LLGVALGASAFAISVPLFLWMSPVLIGLVLAVPIVALTSDPATGAALRAWGLLRTPEEHSAPAVLLRANALAGETAAMAYGSAIERVLHEPTLYAAHLAMLPSPQSRRRGEVDVDLVVALAKIDDAGDAAEALELLSLKERFAALGSLEAMRRLSAKAANGFRASPEEEMQALRPHEVG
jgi:membrane glycosyltransferase